MKWPWRGTVVDEGIVNEVHERAQTVREGAERLRRVAAEVDAATRLIDRNARVLARPDRGLRLDPYYHGPERRRR